MTERVFAGREELAGAVRAAFGGRRRLEGAERLRGGSKKGVYRLTLDDGSTAVAYVWADAENYWGHQLPDDADPFAPASGLGLFLSAHRHLTARGLRVPRLHLADGERRFHPADIAIVEDVRGGTLESLLGTDPVRALPALDRLGHALAAMASDPGPSFGKTAWLDNGGDSRGRSCEALVLDRALTDLAEAAGRDPRIADVQAELDTLLHQLASAVRPRRRHGLVHGELGPDHVLVDARGEPVLIDIEGLMRFDTEWEHVFLRLRLSDHHYTRLTAAAGSPALDPRRLALYSAATHLSLVAGPLRLLDGDFPDRAFMRAIAENHLRAAVALVRAPR